MTPPSIKKRLLVLQLLGALTLLPYPAVALATIMASEIADALYPRSTARRIRSRA
jgi:hypothetical protein